MVETFVVNGKTTGTPPASSTACKYSERIQIRDDLASKSGHTPIIGNILLSCLAASNGLGWNNFQKDTLPGQSKAPLQ